MITKAVTNESRYESLVRMAGTHGNRVSVGCNRPGVTSARVNEAAVNKELNIKLVRIGFAPERDMGTSENLRRA